MSPTLASDEQMIWQGRPAWSNYLGQLFIVALLLAVAAALPFVPAQPVEGIWKGSAVVAAVALVVLGVVAVQRAGSLYIVTSQRAIVERGLISRHVSEIELANVRDIQLIQGVAQRLLGTGRLELSSAGRGSAEVVFDGIAKPDLVKELVRKGMREKSGQP